MHVRLLKDKHEGLDRINRLLNFHMKLITMKTEKKLELAWRSLKSRTDSEVIL
jgi:hypothetical protein